MYKRQDVDLSKTDLDFSSISFTKEEMCIRDRKESLATLPDRTPILKQYRTGRRNAMTGARIPHSCPGP